MAAYRAEMGDVLVQAEPTFDTNEQNYDFNHPFSKGNMGETCLGTHKTTKQEVIRKRVLFSGNIESDRDIILSRLALNEPQLMKRLKNCDHIVKVFYSYKAKLGGNAQDEDVRWRVTTLMEYCENKDLGGYLEKLKFNCQPVIETRIHRWAKDLTDAVRFLHSQQPPIIHRDIKTDNIFLCDNYQKVKLGDFGLARQIENLAKTGSTMCGTPHYMPPEQVTSARSDCWALGVVILQTAILRNPYHELLTAVPELPKWYSPSLRAFICGFLTVDQEQRKTAAEALKHEYLSSNPVERDFLFSDVVFYYIEHLDMVNSLRNTLSSPAGPEIIAGLCSDDDKRDNLLHRAIRSNRSSIVRFLLEEHPRLVDVNALNGMADAAIHLAAARGQTETVALLAAAGADLELPGAGGDNFERLIRKDETRGKILENDYRKKVVRAPAAFTACQHGHFECFKKLIELGADLGATTTPNKSTLLHVAAWCDQANCVEFLLQKGIAVDLIGTSFQRTPLHQACCSNAIAAARKLLSAGANVNRKELKRPNRSPLHLAAILSSKEMLQVLLDNGAELEALDSHGQSALTRAAIAGKMENYQFLTSKGSQLNAAKPYLHEFKRKDSEGQMEWYFILVKPEKLTQLKRIAKTRGDDFSEFGRIVSFGPGSGPDEELHKTIRRRYKFEEAND